MDYFLKVKNASLKVASQGINLIQTVGQDMGLSATAAAEKTPVDEFTQRFQTICQILDNISKVESDVEAEKILHSSKIHEHSKEVLRLLHVEDKIWVSKSLEWTSTAVDSCDDSAVDVDSTDSGQVCQCFNVFVRNRYMDELCKRARHDRPRGSILLVLVMVTSILRNFRFPLLQHATVHKPIRQLLQDASSISSMYNSISKNKQSSSREFLLYVKKVDSQFVQLMSSLWTKISDNPNLVDHFIFVDKRNGAKCHIDAISYLIPLMGKPKIGVIAKEALLISIGLHDSRIDSFILNDTNLKVNIISELTKKFQSGVDTLTSSMNSDPPSTFRDSGRPVNMSTQATNVEKSMVTSVESFVKVLQFCAAVVSCGSIAHEGSVDTISSAIRPALLDRCSSIFLPSLKSSLLENGEEQVLASQFLARRLLLEAFEAPTKEVASPVIICGSYPEHLTSTFSKSINPLCNLITDFICKDEDILQVLIRRVGSVSPSVSVSSMQLLSCLMATCSLPEGVRLVVTDLPTTLSSDTSPIEAVFEDLETSLESFFVKYMPSCNEISIEDYTRASINHILGKLAINNSELFQMKQGHVDCGPVFLVSHQKLQKILSLKYNEQLAVTGLVSKCMIELIGIILCTSSEAVVKVVFEMLSRLFDALHKIRAELLTHQANIVDVDDKITAIREMLGAPEACNPHCKKYVECENHQTVRILESCVVIAELSREMEGSILAFQQLLFSPSIGSVGVVMKSPLAHNSGSMRVTSGRDDEGEMWSTDGEDDSNLSDNEIDNNQNCSTLSLTNLSVDTFLADCDSIELQLEEVLASFSEETSIRGEIV